MPTHYAFYYAGNNSLAYIYIYIYIYIFDGGLIGLYQLTVLNSYVHMYTSIIGQNFEHCSKA